MYNTFLVAIDGPAGAGKSTVSQRVAKELELRYLDTGAMYRAITWKAVNNNVELKDEQALKIVVKETKIRVEGEQETLIIVDGVNITPDIRSPEINRNVSYVASSTVVRKALASLQREVALDAGRIIMEGRDIGTKVLPDAHIKFFLTASLEERSKRRLKDLEKMGIKTALDALQKEIALRDKIDSERKDSPLIKAEDAVLIDTTGYSFHQVVEIIVKQIKECQGYKND